MGIDVDDVDKACASLRARIMAYLDSLPPEVAEASVKRFLKAFKESKDSAL